MSSSENVIEKIDSAIAQYRRLPGVMLPILHGIQDGVGYIPSEAITRIAEALNLSQAEVQGVVSFYPDFHQQAVGQHCLKICQAESCQAMGGAALSQAAQTLLGIDFHATTHDGQLTLEPVYCLGNCACSPAVMLDQQVYGRMTVEKLTELLAEQGGQAK